ncbi:MAG: hypothetical protein IKD45_00550 [Clostridia bacterium]|nr:hypothetical protein [Clostridia bacterium]
MKLFKKIILLLLIAFILLSAAACIEIPPPDNSGGGGNEPPPSTEGGDGDNTGNGNVNTEEDKKIELIRDGTAAFRFVTTAQIGASAVRTIDRLTSRLRSLGVTVEDRVSDSSAADDGVCEIIVGSAARGRGEECSVDIYDLGIEGYVIKAVGNKIVIAGGTSDMTANALSVFIEQYLGVTEDTKKLPELVSVPAALSVLVPTEYEVKSVFIGENELSLYHLVTDTSERETSYAISLTEIRDSIYLSSGYMLPITDISSAEELSHRIILRYVDEAGEGGFRMFREGNDLIVESAYLNALTDSFYSYLEKNLFDIGGDVIFPDDIYYTDDVHTVRYSDFGAVGDGVTDDFEAIKRAHTYANIGGQRVYADEGKVYYIKFLPETIPVKTSVDLCGSTIVVNDKGSDAYKTRNISLFTFLRDSSGLALGEGEINDIAGESERLLIGDTSIPWLAGIITEKSIVKLTNKNHRDVIRHGANQTNGEVRRDVFIMYPDGSIDPETEVCFDFDEITSIEIYSVNDAPITFENGTIINQCCEVVPETNMQNKYHSYARGLRIYRSSVTLKNITHRMEDEPELDTSDSSYGTLSESYPYYAFIYTQMTYKLHVLDCSITGHTTYYEDKPETDSTEGKPAPVPQGTYDLAIEESISVLFENVHQYSPTTIADKRYWGIMTSNWSKDTTFKNSSINRFDAHRTMWGAELYDTDIGHTISVVGGGHFYLEGVTVMSGSTFIDLRGDYGATFRGIIEMVNCTLDAVYDYNSAQGQVHNASKKYTNATVINSGFAKNNNAGYWDWDFGYTCYMPNVIFDNFTSTATKNTYVFPKIPDAVFTTIKNKYILPESITFRNMSKVYPTCQSINSYQQLKSIPVINEGNT